MRADAPATRRSHHAASSTPPATHQPSIAAITGLVSCRRVGPERTAVAQPREVAQVGAGRERLLVAGEHRHAQRVVGVEGQEARRAAARRSRCSPRCARAPGRSAPPPRRRAAPRSSSGDRSRSLPSPPMRVISGSARGRKLVAPEGSTTRPTPGSGARGDLQRARQPRRGAGGGRARPVRRERGDGHRGAVTRRRPGHLRRPGHRRPPGHRGEPGRPAGSPTPAEVVAAPAERFLAGGGPAASLGPGAARPALRLRRLAGAAARPARPAPRCSRARRPSSRRSGGRWCAPSATGAPTW